MSGNKISRKRLFGATMLITGCCIGVGMIGLPVVSNLAGFMPASLAMLLCYMFTTVSGLLLLEATLWFSEKVNLPSIADSTLGKPGKILTVFLFLFLFYSLFVAYLDAGGALFAQMLNYILPFTLSHTAGTLLCMAFIVSVSYAGTVYTDGFNRVMILGMVVAYIALVALGLPNVTEQSLLIADWPQMFRVFPILLICFGYQNLVPSVTYYLEKDVKMVRLAIIIGNFIPFLVYLIWNYVIIGMLNSGDTTASSDAVIVSDLLQSVGKPSAEVLFTIKAFSLFAMLTSFLPSTMSFVDFVKDGFRDYLRLQTRIVDVIVYTLIFLPATICALHYPRVFLTALGFAGGFIDVLLYGVLPAMVILLGRRVYSTEGGYRVFGGVYTPLLILAVSLVLLCAKVSWV